MAVTLGTAAMQICLQLLRTEHISPLTLLSKDVFPNSVTFAVSDDSATEYALS